MLRDTFFYLVFIRSVSVRTFLYIVSVFLTNKCTY